MKSTSTVGQLDDVLMVDEARQYELAPKGRRFLNRLIDWVLIYGVTVLIYIALATIWKPMEQLLITIENGDISGRLLDILITALFSVILYTLQEYLLKGKTIAKYITGTRAVTTDDRHIELGTALKRSLCRHIPFEPFSFLGEGAEGWHDTMSQTKVIMDHGFTPKTSSHSSVFLKR